MTLNAAPTNHRTNSPIAGVWRLRGKFGVSPGLDCITSRISSSLKGEIVSYKDSFGDSPSWVVGRNGSYSWESLGFQIVGFQEGVGLLLLQP